MWSSARNLKKRKNEPRTRLQADDGAAAARGAGARQGGTSSALPTGLDEFEPAFGAMAKAAMQAVSINADGLIYQAKEMVAKLALARRMALVAYSRETFDAGALMSYGPDNIQTTHRRRLLWTRSSRAPNPVTCPSINLPSSNWN
jgi:hypothetical protein